MAREGAFHPELLASAWFHSDRYPEGWFDTDLIPEAVSSLEVVVFDTAAHSEFVQVLISGAVFVQVVDVVGETDAVTVSIPMSVRVWDDAPASEAVALAFNPLLVAVSDDLVAVDTAIVAIPMASVVFDGTPATEAVAVVVNPLTLSVFDAVPADDVCALLRNPLLGAVVDDETPGEFVAVALGSEGNVEISVFDVRTVTERRSVLGVVYDEVLMRHGAVREVRAINGEVLV